MDSETRLWALERLALVRMSDRAKIPFDEVARDAIAQAEREGRWPLPAADLRRLEELTGMSLADQPTA